jgi:uncharacterized protein YwgA
MTIERFRWLAALIAAHPHREVVGRTRLQKTVKLLQRLGFPTDYRYTIYFYGPYSEDLKAGVDLLDRLGLIEEQEKTSKDGTTYYTMKAGEDAEVPEIEKFKPAIDELSSADPVVLELAATYDAFRELGCDHKEALRRLRRKKGHKCDEGRATQALRVLKNIGLPTR